MTDSRLDLRQIPEVEILPNGMRLVMLPSNANSIVAMVSFVPLPGAIERCEEAGLVNFLTKMLLRGTTQRSGADFAEAVEALGTSLGADVADDFSAARMVCTCDAFEPSVQLMAEMLQQPSFEPEEIEKERQSTSAAIRTSDDEKFSFTMKRFLHEFYGGHSYGLPRLGYLETVAGFRREQLSGLHAEFFDPAHFLTVCVGNFAPEQARDLLSSEFARRKTAFEPFRIPDVPNVSSRHAIFRKECEQAFLVVGYRACNLLAEDYPAVRVLNAVLGESMSSRLFTHLRDEKGLAYATGSMLVGMTRAGHLAGYIGTKPESLEEAKAGMLQEFQTMRNELVPDAELQRAKNYIIGKFLIDHQTNFKRAYYLGYFETVGLGMAMDDDYPNRISLVTSNQVLEAANKYLHDPTITELIPEE